MRRAASRIAAAAVVTLTALLGVGMPAITAMAAATPASPVSVTVVSMNPWTPTPSKTPRPFTITVDLYNKTASAIDGVTLSVGRGYPVSSQSGLDALLAKRTLPPGLSAILAKPVNRHGVDVPAHGTTRVTFRTTSTTSTPCRLCLYANAVYPIYISAVDANTGSSLGFTRTFVAATDGAKDDKNNAVRKVDVAWVWPLIDRPHRLTSARVFTDRASLLTSIEPDGRLYRALQVAEGADVPMTLVLDPELVDEVVILARGNYSYLSSSGRTVAGASSSAAALWLSRLRAVLTNGYVTPEFTPYADPDVQSLSTADLSWHARVPPTMAARIRTALGLTTLTSTLSWPAGGAVDDDALDEIARSGATSVLLDGTSVRPTDVEGMPSATTTFTTPHGTLAAALTSPTMQRDVAASIDDTAPAATKPARLSSLPALLAELAVRADRMPYQPRVAVLSAPRYVNADPTAAETVMRASTSSAVSESISLADALDEDAGNASSHARTRRLSSTVPNLSSTIVDTAQRLTVSMRALRALLLGTGQSAGAQPLLSDLNRGLQRIESAAFLSTSTVGTPTEGDGLAGRLRRQVTGLLSGVHIVRPSSGHPYSYTLASANSPLPVTVDNSLPYRVFVQISVQTVGGLPGLTTTDPGTQSIAPDSKQTFRIPTHIQRSGRIALTATLRTAGHDYVLGPQVRLSVHSTVFGTIGIVITLVAALVLLVALALRYIRRLQRRRRKRRATTDDEQQPARVGS